MNDHKVEVLITYWGNSVVPDVVLDAWNNQTDKDFTLSIKKIEERPICRNLFIRKCIEESNADIFFITDSDCIYSDTVIEDVKNKVVSSKHLYYYNRLMLDKETSEQVVSKNMNVSDIVPVNGADDVNEDYRGKQENNYPNNPGAYGYCQIGFKELMLNIIPNKPILGFHVYDSIMQESTENIQLVGGKCYHLNIAGSKPKLKYQMRVMDRTDFGFLFNLLGLHGYGLELGVQKGNLSVEIAKIWAGDHIFLVDSWEHFSEGYDDVANVSTEEHIACMVETIKKMNEIVDTKSFSTMRMRGEMAAKIFPDNFLDWVYIDANHGFKDTLLDISDWYPKVKEGGIIAGDDFDMDTVRKAVFYSLLAIDKNIELVITTEGNRNWYFVKPITVKSEKQ